MITWDQWYYLTHDEVRYEKYYQETYYKYALDKYLKDITGYWTKDGDIYVDLFWRRKRKK